MESSQTAPRHSRFRKFICATSSKAVVFRRRSQDADVIDPFQSLEMRIKFLQNNFIQ